MWSHEYESLAISFIYRATIYSQNLNIFRIFVLVLNLYPTWLYRYLTHLDVDELLCLFEKVVKTDNHLSIHGSFKYCKIIHRKDGYSYAF